MKNTPHVCYWCKLPADETRNLVRASGYYEHAACSPSGDYAQVEAVSFPGVKPNQPVTSQPQPATLPPPGQPPATQPAEPSTTTAASWPQPLQPAVGQVFCVECELYPPIENSEECRYCAGEFEDWRAEQYREKNRYLAVTCGRYDLLLEVA